MATLTDQKIQENIGSAVTFTSKNTDTYYNTAKAYKKGMDYSKKKDLPLGETPFSTNILFKSNNRINLSKDVYNLLDIIKLRSQSQIDADGKTQPFPYVLLGKKVNNTYNIDDVVTPFGKLSTALEHKVLAYQFSDEVLNDKLTKENTKKMTQYFENVAKTNVNYDCIIAGTTHFANEGASEMEVAASNCHTFEELAKIIELSKHNNPAILGSAVINNVNDFNVVLFEQLNENEKELVMVDSVFANETTKISNFTDKSMILDNDRIINKASNDKEFER